MPEKILEILGNTATEKKLVIGYCDRFISMGMPFTMHAIIGSDFRNCLKKNQDVGKVKKIISLKNSTYFVETTTSVCFVMCNFAISQNQCQKGKIEKEVVICMSSDPIIANSNWNCTCLRLVSNSEFKFQYSFTPPIEALGRLDSCTMYAETYNSIYIVRIK